MKCSGVAAFSPLGLKTGFLSVPLLFLAPAHMGLGAVSHRFFIILGGATTPGKTRDEDITIRIFTTNIFYLFTLDFFSFSCLKSTFVKMKCSGVAAFSPLGLKTGF